MANTLLTTPRTMQATSNPQANVNQVQQAQQMNSGANGTQGLVPQTNGQAVSPVTIQVNPAGTQNQQQVSGQLLGQNNMQNLQQGQQQQGQLSSAPTPQAYQQPQNNNPIDFNQIYSSYQSQYGTNPSNQNQVNQVRKTSFNTTIVTPKANPNTVEGQYQSAYSDTINSLISEVLNRQSQGFQYDPSNDSNLKIASEYAAASAMEQMGARGILNSSSTAERVASVVSELIPKYEDLAFTRWSDALNQLANTAELVMNYDNQQFSYWKDAKDREFENKKFDYQKEQDTLENAWKRVDELGYVDNGASTILGVSVGTLSKDAREAKEQREFELKKMKEQLEIEQANNVALAKIRSDLEYNNSARLQNLKNQQERANMEREYQLKNQSMREEYSLRDQNTKNENNYKTSYENNTGRSSSSSSNGKKLPSGYNLYWISSNTIAIKEPSGKYSSLTIQPGTKNSMIINWGKQHGLNNILQYM